MKLILVAGLMVILSPPVMALDKVLSKIKKERTPAQLGNVSSKRDLNGPSNIIMLKTAGDGAIVRDIKER